MGNCRYCRKNDSGGSLGAGFSIDGKAMIKSAFHFVCSLWVLRKTIWDLARHQVPETEIM